MTIAEHVPPRPDVDRDSAEWWAGVARHELVLQQCTDCEGWRWPARNLCSRCGSFATEWQPISGRGTIASWVVTHHAFGPWLQVPYVVVTVRLDEQDDLLVIGGYDGPPDGPTIDAPVEASFIDHDPPGAEPFTLLSWRPRTA